VGEVFYRLFLVEDPDDKKAHAQNDKSGNDYLMSFDLHREAILAGLLKIKRHELGTSPNRACFVVEFAATRVLSRRCYAIGRERRGSVIGLVRLLEVGPSYRSSYKVWPDQR